jgi:hypothetical protein
MGDGLKPHIGFSDHVRRRFVERYRLAVSAEELRLMAACIRRGEAVLLKGGACDDRAVYAAPRPSRKGKTGKLAPVVYDRRFDAIVTVLPEHRLLAHRDVIERFRARRVAEFGEQAWPLVFPIDASVSRDGVRLALDSSRLCFHVHCKTSVCPFPVSIYVRDARHRCGGGRREIAYLKANGAAASNRDAAFELLRQQFQTCLAVRTGHAPPEAPALAEAFIGKLEHATRAERLRWAWQAARQPQPSQPPHAKAA